MATSSNVNLNLALGAGNTGIIGTFPDIGIIRTLVLVPKGFVIPQSTMVSPTAFATYQAGKFVNDTPANQWYAFTNLDKFTDETKKTSEEDTGRLNLAVYSFPAKMSFRYMLGMGNFIEATNFNNCQGQYDYFFIDDFGNWHGCQDVTGGTNGLAAYTNQQFFIPNRGFRTTQGNTAYMIMISLADPLQTNGQFKLYQANTQADSLVMLGNARLTDISDTIPPAVTTTSVTFIIKSGQDSRDIVKDYGSVLTAACFVNTNLTPGGTVISPTFTSITTGTGIVGGETYYWVKGVLSAAPTSGNVVRTALAAPSVTNPIIPNFNLVSLPLNNVNGQNCCIHTFA